MDYAITILLVVGTTGFFFGMARLKALLATNEVSSFNFMSSENLSPKAQSLKTQATYGFATFMIAVFCMLIFVSNWS